MFDDKPLGDSDFEVEDETFFNAEGNEASLDVRAVVRVRYSRGLVNKLSDLRSSREVQVAEWEAPHIPQTVLESIEREAVDALEGEWGDPRIGDPTQVDLIDLETDTDVISIQVFNRAICLVRAESEEMRRIHRVCCALEAASPDDHAADQRDTGAGTATSAIQRSKMQRSSGVDMSAVLKQHRRQGGTCALCGDPLTRQRARKHLAACVPAHDIATGGEVELRQIRVTAPGLPAYWLDLEVKGDARLDVVDSFLRGIWVECCGHLSAFNIGAVKYLSRGYDFGLLGLSAAFASGGSPNAP